MTLELPTLLVLLGAALMTLAIFAPKPATREGPVLAADAAFNAWHTLPEHGRDVVHFAYDVPLPTRALEPILSALPTLRWPLLVDPRATTLDAGARSAMIDALASLREPWAEDVLAHAALEETDPSVRSAIARSKPE